LQSLGFRVRQHDLNAEFVYDHLTRPDVLARLHGKLAAFADQGVKSDPEYWFRALNRLCEAHGRCATLGTVAIREFLTDRRAVRGRPFAHWQKRGAPSSAGCDPFTARCLDDGLFWASFVEALHYLLFSPRSTRVEDVLRFAAEPPPVLSQFLASKIDAWASGTRPLLVGFALWSTAQVPVAIGFTRMLRALWPDVPLVAGGAWCSGADSLLPTFPELFDAFDAVVIGQGDDAMGELCARALAAEAFSGIANVAVRVDGNVQVPADVRSRRIVDSSLPDFDGLDLSQYPQGDTLPVRLQEGCTWRRCSFCYHIMDRIHGRSAGVDPSAVIERALPHIQGLSVSKGVERVFLLDHAVPAHLMELLAGGALSAGVRFQWLAMARFEGRLPISNLRAIADSGCIGLHFGLESTDQHTLSRMNKGVDLGAVDRELDALAAAGIPASVFLMHLPGQTRDDVERDLAWVHARHDRLEGFTIARFEVGRGTYAFRHPHDLDIDLQPGHERDIDVFDVPYRSRLPMLSTVELMHMLEDGTRKHASLRGRHADGRTCLASNDTG
jgi:hypothetical protein